jgi:hypothetical protein
LEPKNKKKNKGTLQSLSSFVVNYFYDLPSSPPFFYLFQQR